MKPAHLDIASNFLPQSRKVGRVTPCAPLLASLTALVPMNPNGIPTQSPGLRGTSYPGSPSANVTNPNGVAANSFPPIACAARHNPVGVANFSRRFPRVASSSQPWAGGHNLFGIGASARLPVSSAQWPEGRARHSMRAALCQFHPSAHGVTRSTTTPL
jgi:hypothetical protein